MVSNKKILRAEKGPGLFEIILSVLLSLIFGALLGVLHLIFKPVEVVAKPVDDSVAGQVYFVEGSVNGSKARQWMRKRQMLASGAAADIVFTEEELNAWMANTVAQPAKAGDEARALFTPGKVNFRIRDDVMQVGLIGQLSVLGFVQELVFQARGTFKPEAGGGFAFVPDELYVGSLPVHKIPRAVPELMKRVVAAQELPEDLVRMWSRLKLVAVEGNSLRIVTP